MIFRIALATPDICNNFNVYLYFKLGRLVFLIMSRHRCSPFLDSTSYCDDLLKPQTMYEVKVLYLGDSTVGAEETVDEDPFCGIRLQGGSTHRPGAKEDKGQRVQVQ